MPISNQLLSEFARSTNTKIPKQNEYSMYATVNSVDAQGNTLVIFDGSDITTPVESSVMVKENDRVIVSIKDRKPVVTSNLTTKVINADVIIADEARIGRLEADSVVVHGNIETINGNISSINGNIQTINGNISTVNGNIQTINGNISTIQGNISTVNGNIQSINGNITTINGDITTVNGKITAATGRITSLESDKVTVRNLIAEKATISDVSAAVINGTIANFTGVVTASTLRAKDALRIYNSSINDYRNVMVDGRTSSGYDNSYLYVNPDKSYARVVLDGVFEAISDFYVHGMLYGLTNARVTGNIECTKCIQNSDRKLKHDIKDTAVTSALDEIMQMKHRSFVWNNTDEEVSLGFVAQELQEIDPELVVETDNVLGIDTFRLLATATKAIQELSDKVDKLERRIQELEIEHNKLSSEE